jgi:hypothetical protein
VKQHFWLFTFTLHALGKKIRNIEAGNFILGRAKQLAASRLTDQLVRSSNKIFCECGLEKVSLLDIRKFPQNVYDLLLCTPNNVPFHLSAEGFNTEIWRSFRPKRKKLCH